MTAKHHIRRLALQVHHQAGGDGFAVRQEAARWQQEIWLPMLERLLDKYDVSGQVITIPKLEVAIQTTSKAWGTDMAEVLLKQIEKALVKQIGNTQAGESQVATTRREVELLLFYLHRGYLPWWAEIENAEQWQSWLSAFMQGFDRTTALLLAGSLSDSRARARLIEILNDALFWRFVSLLASSDTATSVWESDWYIIQKAALQSDVLRAFYAHYKDAILLALSRQDGKADINRQFSVQLFQNIKPPIRHLSLPGDIKNDFLREMLAGAEEVPQTKDEKEDLMIERIEHNEPIYLSDAGLVIIAPFLKELFKQVQLLGEEDLIINTSKAVALVYYMARGTSYAPEFELVLPKLLCGVPLEEPISIKDVQLSEDECYEADTVLRSVLEHWAALKNTSIDGLRVNFLQREGRLHWKENAWELKVQQESYDLLLSYIPWSISYIKLPWMDTLLHVDWN